MIRSGIFTTIWLALSVNGVGAEQQPTTFVVTAPPTTNVNDVVYLTGNCPALGNWKPNAVPLSKRPDGKWETKVSLSAAKSIEYKYTAGDWSRVEKTKDGRDRPNRRLEKPTGEVADEVEGWGKPPISTRTGELIEHPQFESKILVRPRTVWVWLPSAYRKEPNRRFPVCYFHDGQNVFDAATSAIGVEWRADETAQRLIADKKIPPILLVAIGNSADRLAEYTPSKDAKFPAGGNADRYAAFFTTELKPFIDANYRTQPDPAQTALVGSSLGGLVTLYLGSLPNPPAKRLGALSPSLWWDGGRWQQKWTADPAPFSGQRIWLDMGDAEAKRDALHGLQHLATALSNAGAKTKVEIIDGGQHNERAWAQRLDRVLVHLFAEEGNR